MGALEFQINLSGNFTSNLDKGNAALGETEVHAKKAAHEFEIFESELGKASGSLGGFGFNLGAIAKGGSLFTFDLAEAAKSAVEVVHKLIESFVDLGSEILKVAGESQDLDLAINLDVGKEGSEKVNKLADGFAKTSRFSGEQIKKSLLPLIEQGGLGDEKQLDDIATAATDIAARRNSGIAGAQAALGAFQKIALKREVNSKMLSELAINEKDFYGDLGSLMGVSAKEAEKATKEGKVKSQTLLSVALNQVAQREGGSLGTATESSSKTLGGTLERLANLKDEMFRKLAESPGLALIKQRLDEFIDAMNGPVGEKLMAGMEEVFQYVGDLFKPENIQSFFEGVSSGISTVKAVFDVLWPVVKIAVEWFAFYKAGMLAYQAYTAIAAISTMGFSGAVGQLTLALMANPLGLIIGLLALVGVAIYEVYQHWDGIKDFFMGIANVIGDAFTWMWDEVKGAFAGIFDSGEDLFMFFLTWPFRLLGVALDMGKALWQGLRDGILGGGVAAIADAISQLADGAVGGLKNLLGIHSPSAVMAELGGFTAEGFALGIEDGSDRTESAARSALGDSAVAGASGASGGVGGSGGGVVFSPSIVVNVGGGAHDGHDIGSEIGQAVRLELERFLEESGIAAGVAA